MHSVTLAAFSSTVIRLTPALLAHGRPPTRDAAQKYWLNSRFRQEEWNRKLGEHREALSKAGTVARERRWYEIMPVLQEILLSEPLTRCVACLSALMEADKDAAELNPLAHSVLAEAHSEARNRCLHLMVFGNGLSVESAVSLNRMRRKVEYYTDQLLTLIPGVSNLERYLFDDALSLQPRYSPPRNPRCDQHWLELQTHCLAMQLWRGILGDVDSRAASGKLNHRISQSLLQFLPAEVFDGVGLPKTSNLSWQLASHSPESDDSREPGARPELPAPKFIKQHSHPKLVNKPHRRW